MSTGRRLAGAAAWTLVLKLFGATSGLFVAVILARILTSEELGYFFIAQSTAVFSALIARLGMKQPVVRLISTALVQQKLFEIPRILTSVFLIVLVGCFAVWIAIWCGGGQLIFSNLFSAPTIYESIFVWLILLTILAFQVPLAEAYRGLHRAPEAMLFDGPLGNGLFLLILVFIYMFRTTVSYAMVLTIFCVVTGLSFSVGTNRLLASIEKSGFRASILFIKEVFLLGIPVYIFNLTTYLASLAGLWICAAALSASDAAVYGSVYRFMLVVSLPLFVLNMIIQSVVVQLYFEGKKVELQRNIRVATTVATAFSLPVTALALLFAKPILIFSLGEEYAGGSVALMCMVFSSFVAVWAGPCPNILVLTGYSAISSKIILFVSAISISASLILVKSYGISGVAAATATGMIAQSLITRSTLSRLTGVSTHAYTTFSELITFTKDFVKVINSIRMSRYLGK